VEEEVLPAASLDETETLVRQPLDGAFSHSIILVEAASYHPNEGVQAKVTVHGYQ
jgi:hypothetical protein